MLPLAALLLAALFLGGCATALRGDNLESRSSVGYEGDAVNEQPEATEPSVELAPEEDTPPANTETATFALG
jgi:PBP1b-binding outer membrane lipoprotein LpoB